MTLLVTAFAAVTATAVWYFRDRDNKFKTRWLCFMYWGASIMWTVDSIFEFAGDPNGYEHASSVFTPSGADMLNDLFLGLSVVALALVIWVVILLVSDPEKRFRKR
jgi:hypothetical protein